MTFTRKITMAAAVLALSLGLLGGPAGTAQAQQKDEPIYGSQMMTEQERMEYRNQMMNAKSDQEREQIRMEHHTQMQARAKERGVTLPENPPMGKGMGPGKGMGSGMGTGSGMGMKKKGGGG